MSALLERIIAHGNRGANHGVSRVICRDGFRVSVIAGAGTYCAPRPSLLEDRLLDADDVAHDYPGPYTHVEVGFPSARPEPWDTWEAYADDPEAPTDTVYGRMPVPVVRALVRTHDGEVAS